MDDFLAKILMKKVQCFSIARLGIKQHPWNNLQKQVYDHMQSI